MRCDRVQYLYDDYTRGSLAAGTMSRVEEHLASCSICRGAFERNDAVAELVRSQSVVAHPGPQYFDELAARVMGRLDAPARPDEVLAFDGAAARGSDAWRRPIWWAGGAAAAALLVLGLLPSGGPDGVDGAQNSRVVAAKTTGKNGTDSRTGAFTPSADVLKFEIPGAGAQQRVLTTQVAAAGAGDGAGSGASKSLASGGRPEIRFVDAAHAMLSVWMPGFANSEGAGGSMQTIEKGVATRGVDSGAYGGAAGVQVANLNAAAGLGSAKGAAAKAAPGDLNGKIGTGTARGGDIKLVSSHAAAAGTAMPPEVLQQILAIKTRMMAGGDEAVAKNTQQLQDGLQSMIDKRAGEAPGMAQVAWVRETNYYLKAQRELASGKLSQASADYRTILMIDDGAPAAQRPTALATCAALELGDLFYSEWDQFKEARDYYRRAQGGAAAVAGAGVQASGAASGAGIKAAPGATASGASGSGPSNTASDAAANVQTLTAVEREHIARQLDRLSKYEKNDWEDLQLLNFVRREDWEKATTALRKLLADADAAPLLPEAARAVADRMNGTPKPAPDTALEIYNLLAKHVAIEQNKDIRAWLELSLGDLALAQFKDSKLANEQYRKAVDDGADTAAGTSARGKLDALVERQLIDLVR